MTDLGIGFCKMSVHLRKDGRWFVQYRDKGTGKLKQEYFGRGLEGEHKARKRNDELNLAPRVKRTPKRESPTFSDLFNAYLAAKQGSMQPDSMDNLSYKMNGVILPEIGGTQAIHLTKYRMDQL